MRQQDSLCLHSPMVVGSIFTHENESIFINDFISGLWYQTKSVSLSTTIQHTMSRKYGGE